jgi:hypothetical protein
MIFFTFLLGMGECGVVDIIEARTGVLAGIDMHTSSFWSAEKTR